MYAQKGSVGRGRERAPYATLRQYQAPADCTCRTDAPVINQVPERPGTPDCIMGYPLAMVYAPEQRFENLYECEQWLEKGTIFQDLDFPFRGSRKGR